jgi:acyl-coenzyme A synthetase/AMP-(fatty) acid ligase
LKWRACCTNIPPCSKPRSWASPTPLRGQIVKAFVILRPKIVASEELKHELQQFCKHTVAPYKYPREIEFVAELPKTISGKTRHAELRRRHLAGLSA